MKRYITYCLVIAALITSCKKDKKNNPDAKKLYPITFNISGLKQTTKTSGITGKLTINALPDSTQKLYYVLSGAQTKLLFQTSAVPGFGIIKDSLPAGNYTVGLIQARGNLQSTNSAFTTDSDTYFKLLPITVSNGPINSNVTLDRINGKLEVNIEDAIPATISSISVTITSDANNFLISAGAKPQSPVIRTYTKTITPADIGKTNVKISGPIFNVTAPFSVTIKATGTGTSYLPKKVDNVTCDRNTKTTLTGKLFTAPTSGFDISINGSFDTDTIKTGL
jgi:hypothetical protein